MSLTIQHHDEFLLHAATYIHMLAELLSFLCVRSDKSSYWLHNIVGSESSYSDSTFYEPDAKSTKVSCPSGQKFIGVRVAQTYGGIDYLDFVCAPTCYTAPVGAHVTVGSVSVTVGSASEEPASAAAAVAPTPSQTNTCTPSHIGPGATLQAYNPALVSPTIVKASCPGELPNFCKCDLQSHGI